MTDVKKTLEAELSDIHHDIVKLVRKAAKDPQLSVNTVTASKVMWEADKATLLQAAYLVGQIDVVIDLADRIGVGALDNASLVVGLKDALYLV